MEDVPFYWKDARSKSGKIGIKFLAFPIWNAKKGQVYKSLTFYSQPSIKKKKKSKSPILLLHCSLSTSVFLGDLISNEEEPNEEEKKCVLKNWDLIKAFGCFNCSTTQQLTHWYYFLSFLFLFPLYLISYISINFIFLFSTGLMWWCTWCASLPIV